MLFFFAIFTFISTLIGGLIGLKYKDKLHLILGFTAGVLLAVVAFDIFPEIFDIVEKTKISPTPIMVALVFSFLLFHILEKMLLIHHSQEAEYGTHRHPTVGKLSAVALTGHSFLDGIGIGIGFQVSNSVGILIALAVIAHDFSDGLNTVSLILAHKNHQNTALKFLIADASAPIFGVLLTFFIKIPENILVLYLGFFAGFLLYIGTADILPEAHSEHSSVKTILMTVLGVIFIFGITRII